MTTELLLKQTLMGKSKLSEQDEKECKQRLQCVCVCVCNCIIEYTSTLHEQDTASMFHTPKHTRIHTFMHTHI